MTTLISIMVFAGIFGGTVNFFQLYSKDYFGWNNYWKCVIVGLGASFLVPLFLQMISSNLVDGTGTNNKDCLVFLGFCLIASIFSIRFIETIGDKILKQVEKASAIANEAKEIAKINKEEVGLIASKATEIDPTEIISPSSFSIIDATTINHESNEGTTASPLTDFAAIINSHKNNPYTFRTLNGIIRDTGINKEKVELSIGLMKKENWIKEIVKDGKVLYALTDDGIRLQLKG